MNSTTKSVIGGLVIIASVLGSIFGINQIILAPNIASDVVASVMLIYALIGGGGIWAGWAITQSK